MKKIEKREKEIVYCDICGDEITNISKCMICGADICTNKSTCSAYSLEIYKYAKEFEDTRRYNGHVCVNCSDVVDSIVEVIK